jgi:DNA-3-methyladenine glycosylase II
MTSTSSERGSGSATAEQLTNGQFLRLQVRGPYELADVAMMGFGHRDERTFDHVMRMAFCLDGDYERHVGVAARQRGAEVELEVHTAAGTAALTAEELERVQRQVARVISLDHDGQAFHQLCLNDRALAAVHSRAPGFRPALFYSPYEAAVWSIISARRARGQGITLRTRMAELYGATFDLAGVRTVAVPTPSQLLAVETVPGLPADRMPRLHAVAEAAQRGELDAVRLRELPPDDAMADLQRLPGIGPFYSALIVIRACGHADALSLAEGHSRQAARELYGVDHELTDAEFERLAEGWRPFRTWVAVMLRALAGRAAAD